MKEALCFAAVLATSSSLLEAEEPALRSGGRDPYTCDVVSRQLFGVPATRLSPPVKEPKRLRYVKADYPEVPAGTVGTGVWVGEALIGPDGLVRSVSVLRDLKFTPPFPEFSKAISKSILNWRYAPTMVDGKAVPVCMTVSVNIHWR